VVSGNSRSGNYSARTSASISGFEQTIAVSPITTYNLSGWAKVMNNGETVWIGAKGYGGSETSWAVTTTGYSQASLSFTTGSSSTQATVYCYKHTGSGYAYCDFSVTAK